MSSKKIIPFLFLLIISVLIFLLGFFAVTKYTERERNYFDNYPRVEYNMNYQGVVLKRHYTHGITFIAIEGHIKFSLPWAYNYNYKPFFLGDFLRVGDEIHKPSHSDTLFVSRDSLQYYFVLEKYINE